MRANYSALRQGLDKLDLPAQGIAFRTLPTHLTVGVPAYLDPGAAYRPQHPHLALKAIFAKLVGGKFQGHFLSLGQPSERVRLTLVEVREEHF